MKKDHIEIKEVTTKRELLKFIYLPKKIHAIHNNWLPPIYMDDKYFFNKEKNPAFRNCETIMYLAYKNAELVGRVMGIIHHTYNKVNKLKTARFGYIETYYDKQVFSALCKAIEEWSLKHGMTKLIGPYGFSDKDPQGFQVDGFMRKPIIDTYCNFPYMIELIEKEGFKKEVDCLSYKLDLTKELPPVYDRIEQRIKFQNGYKLMEFTSRKQLKPFIKDVLRLANEAYAELYGFVAMDEKEMEAFTKRYLPILDVRFIKLIFDKDVLIAFIVGLPNLTPGIQKAKGKLFPFGIFHILNSMRQATQLDLMLGAVKPRYQRRGLEVMMAMALFRSCLDAGYKNMEIHLVLESNTKMIAELTRSGSNCIKRFRVYQKSLV